MVLHLNILKKASTEEFQLLKKSRSGSDYLGEDFVSCNSSESGRVMEIWELLKRKNGSEFERAFFIGA